MSRSIIKDDDSRAYINKSKTDINKEQLEESQKRAVNESSVFSKSIKSIEDEEETGKSPVTVRDYSNRIRLSDNSSDKPSRQNVPQTNAFKTDDVSVKESIKGGIRDAPNVPVDKSGKSGTDLSSHQSERSENVSSDRQERIYKKYIRQEASDKQAENNGGNVSYSGINNIVNDKSSESNIIKDRSPTESVIRKDSSAASIVKSAEISGVMKNRRSIAKASVIKTVKPPGKRLRQARVKADAKNRPYRIKDSNSVVKEKSDRVIIEYRNTSVEAAAAEIKESNFSDSLSAAGKDYINKSFIDDTAGYGKRSAYSQMTKKELTKNAAEKLNNSYKEAPNVIMDRAAAAFSETAADSENGKTASVITAAGASAIPNKTIFGKTVKGELRRIKKNYSTSAENILLNKNAMLKKGILYGNAGANKILTTGKTTIKRCILNGLEEAGESDIGFKAVEGTVKGAMAAPTVINTTEKTIVGTAKAIYNTPGTIIDGAKAVYNLPGNTVKAAKKGINTIKNINKRVRKFAALSTKAKAKACGKLACKAAKAAAVKAAAIAGSALSAVLSAAAPFFIFIFLVVVIAAIVASVFFVSIKTNEEQLTAAWEWVTKQDALFEQEIKEYWYNFPNNDPDYNPDFQHQVWDRVFDINSVQAEIDNISIRSNADTYMLMLDAIYQDYKMADVKDFIDYIHCKTLKTNYNITHYAEYHGDSSDYMHKLLESVYYSDASVYILGRKSDWEKGDWSADISAAENNSQTDSLTKLTNKNAKFENEIWELMKENGVYTSLIELASPFSKTDYPILYCTRRYGYEYNGSGLYKNEGINLSAAPGTAVYAPKNGKVSVSGDEITIKGGSKYIKIKNMASISAADGADVKKGDPIGTVGSAGFLFISYYRSKAGSDVPLNPSFYFDNIQYAANQNSSYAEGAIDLSNYPISDNLEGSARAVVQAAIAMIGSGGYSGKCAALVSTVYQNAGLGYHGGNGNDYSRANKLIVDGSGHVDYTKIPVGAAIGIKYGTGAAGYAYGHVGIYIGVCNGVPTVVEGGGSVVRATSLDHFYDYFVTSNPNSVYGNDIGWGISSTNGTVSPLYFES